MKPIYIVIVAVVASMLTTLLLVPRLAESEQRKEPMTDLQRRQEMWLDALEWCESRGVETAVNKMDRDGTPSYGSLQFKPSTFTYFSERYGLPTTTSYMDPSQQRQIVRFMINDPKITDAQLRNQQFPDCIQRKVGLPPRK